MGYQQRFDLAPPPPDPADEPVVWLELVSEETAEPINADVPVHEPDRPINADVPPRRPGA